MLRTSIALLFILSLSFAFCHSNTSRVHIKPVVPDNSILTSQNNLFESIPQFSQQINLPSLQNGVDSFEYRLWLHVGPNIINLVRIQYVNSSWEISKIIIKSHVPDYEFKYKDTLNHLLETIVDSVSIQRLIPNIPISDFLDSMQYFSLQDAPPNIRIANAYSLPTDSWRYTFELADSKSYRIIEFNCATYFDLQEFHDKIIQMLQFLKRTLNIHFRICY